MNISLKLSSIGLAAMVSLVTACGGEQGAGATPTPTGFAISGLLTVPADVIWTQKANPEATSGGPCLAKDGYDDIKTGTQVVVRDAEGTTVALGQLQAGRLHKAAGTLPLECAFQFRADDVPEGSTHYSIEVSHRGEVSYSREDLNKGALALTLG